MLKSGFEFAPGYRLQEFLGRGQFGQVWRATAPGGAAAAVKFIDLSDGQGRKEYEGVKRVKQIRHANLMPITAIWLLDGQGQVIPETPSEHLETIDLSSAAEQQPGRSIIFDGDVEPSWLVVAMLLGGQSLQQRLRVCVQDGLPGIPPKELIRYMDESAKGIDYLNTPQHDLGDGPIAIQHSDVKPANIVLIGDSAVVCDFGLARILTRNQVTATSAAGTPAYMAPEAISGKPSRTSDQYALAVTYYHLRTGTLPVNDGSLWEVLDAHRQGNLKLGLVPQPEQEIIRKATDLKWENRFESNVDMVDAMRDALRAEGQTTPSFISKSGNVGSPSSSAAPGQANDVIDTLDLNQPVAVVQADPDNTPTQSLTPTASFVPSEQPTEEGFAQDTMPTLAEAAPASDRAADDGKKSVAASLGSASANVKLIAGVCGGAVLVASLFGLFTIIGGSEEPIQEPRGGGSEPVVVDPPVVIPETTPNTTPDPGDNPQQLVADAILLLDDNEDAAIETFRRAIEMDFGLEHINPILASGHTGNVMNLLITPDGEQTISVADGNEPFVWKLTSSDAEPITTPIQLTGHQGYISTIAMTGKGRRLLTGAFDDSVPRIWSLDDVSADSTSLELATDETKHFGSVMSVAWHPTDQIAITASDDDDIIIWKIGRGGDGEVGTITEASKFQLESEISEVRVDPSGRWLAVLAGALDHEVLIFSWSDILDTFSERSAPEPFKLDITTARHIEFLGGGDVSRLVVGHDGGGVSIFRVVSKDKSELDDNGSSRKAHRQNVEAMRVVSDSDTNWIATGGQDGSAHWWKRAINGDNKLSRQFANFGNAVSSIDVSADGRWVAVGTDAAAAWLWDTESNEKSGAIMLPLGTTSADSIRFDPKSRWLIAGCDDGKLRIWDLRLAKLLALTRPVDLESELNNPPQVIRLDETLTSKQ